jgi:hypothetical protein
VSAIILFERWHWTPDVVLELDVEDFQFYVEQAREIAEAIAKAG